MVSFEKPQKCDPPISKRKLRRTKEEVALNNDTKLPSSHSITPFFASTAPASDFPDEKIVLIWISLTRRINVWHIYNLVDF